ncbi:unnamed protein product [Oreochromis niloticus]|nr:unnamed protein product [Mustela putorius furo]
MWSASFQLKIVYERRPVLTVSPSWLSPGASVTLNCEVEHPSAGWSFYWYKAVPDLSEKSSSYELLPDGSGTAQDSYIIHGQTHTAGYVCRAGRGDPEYHTDHSQPKFVWSADAVLTIEPSWSSFFTGESVTFKCDMNEGKDSDWYYQFKKDGQEFLSYGSKKDHKLQIISTRDSGEYQCSGSSVSSHHIKNSNTVSITVLADKPRATLTAGTTIIPVGGSVTLSCSVQSSDGWKYEWFRRTQTTSEVPIRDQQNRDIRVSQGGIYRCFGTRGNPVYYTDSSDDVTIEITFSNKVVVKQQPNWPQIFRGETITLTCEVQEGGETTEWEYEWRGPSTPTQWTHNNDVTFRVSESSSGDYMCKSRRRDDSYSSTEWSEAFTLSVSISNKVVVKQQPNWPQIFRGETITLTCEVQEGGETIEWESQWRGPRTPTQWTHNNDVTFRVSESSSGDYMCKSRRRDDSYSSTEWSEAFTLSESSKSCLLCDLHLTNVIMVSTG